ncbi:MAG: RidA family protein [Bacteroidales bacterium]|nr:RidA family protein [Bacteroidota bacterium]MBL6949368.1 RidA family protein [Bacteroidales bacterium]
MKIISTEQMTKPIGHYSQVIEHNGIIYLSGQLPVDPETKTIPETIEEQSSLVLSKIAQLLTEAGSSKQQVLQMRVYISDIALWDQVNDVYSEFFGDHKPVRCIVPTRELHFGSLVEMEATAVAGDEYPTPTPPQ